MLKGYGDPHQAMQALRTALMLLAWIVIVTILGAGILLAIYIFAGQ
jgi:hypothetical protein